MRGIYNREEERIIYYIMVNGIYQTLYELLATHVYGGIDNLTNSQILVNTTMSTIGCLFVEVLPFIVVYFGVRMACNAFNRLWG